MKLSGVECRKHHKKIELRNQLTYTRPCNNHIYANNHAQALTNIRSGKKKNT